MKKILPALLIVILLLLSTFMTGCTDDDDEEEGDENGDDGDDDDDNGNDDPGIGKLGEDLRDRLGTTYIFGLEEVEYEMMADDIDGWYSNAVDRGITIVGFELFTTDGYTVIDSDVLRSAGFSKDEDYGYLFGDLLEGAAKYNITLLIMLETIGHIVEGSKDYDEDKIDDEKLTTDALKDLITEITDEAKRYGASIVVNEEAMVDNYMDAVREGATANGIPYMHFFDDLKNRPDIFLSEDYGYYPLDAKNNNADKQYLTDIYEWGAYLCELGMLNIMYGNAFAAGKDYGVLTAGGWGMGEKTHQNIALLRAVQFGAQVYFFVAATNDDGPEFAGEQAYVDGYNFKTQLLPLLEEYGREDTDKAKPIANLILDTPPLPASEDESDAYDFFYESRLSSAGAITNAMLAAGYDIRVTQRTPFAGADLYYVLSCGLIWGDGPDMTKSLADLADGSTPVYYQAAGEVPDDQDGYPNWHKVMNKLGYSDYYPLAYDENANANFFDPIPQTVSYNFTAGTSDVRYGGYTFGVWDSSEIGEFSWEHYINYMWYDDYEGDVLLKGKTCADGDDQFDDDVALIFKEGNVYFVNGGYLHLAASSILANIMAGETIYNKPSYGYFTNGESRSVFYAPYDVDIDLNVMGGTNVTEFDESGNEVASTAVKLENGRLHGSVDKFHLIIVK